jgi:hypothetical protein
MHLNHRRKRAGAGRPVQPREQRPAILTLVFDILDADSGPDLRARIGFEHAHRVIPLGKTGENSSSGGARRLPPIASRA